MLEADEIVGRAGVNHRFEFRGMSILKLTQVHKQDWEEVKDEEAGKVD